MHWRGSDPPLHGHHPHATHTAMEHTTTDIAALEAEIAALEAEDAAQSARVNALLATGSTAVRLADCRVMAQLAARELAVQERYQRRISRAIDAL